MSGAKLGSMIGAVGGLVFVVANAGALPGPWPLVLWVAGVLAFVGVTALVVRARLIGRGVEPTRPQMRAFGYTVLAEFLAIPLGSQVLVRALDLPTATLPWVATVIGVHFLVFARVFGEPVFTWLGLGVTLCGVVGIVLAARDAPQSAISLVGGILPGIILLASVGWSAWVGQASSTRSSPS